MKKTFSVIALAMVGMTGLAAAQAKADPKAADPKMAPKADAKAADPKAPAAGAPEMKPPQELADMAKAAAGSWKCKGQGMDHTNKMIDMTGTSTVKLDVESFTTFDAASKKWKRVMVESGGGWSSGESDGLKDNKMDWNLTSHIPGAMAAMMGGMTEMMFRDHEDMSDAKAGLKQWGEFSPDKGKTWTKVYEITCKK
jgi:hypothetical protein